MKNQYINAIVFLIIACLFLPFGAIQSENTSFGTKDESQSQNNNEPSKAFTVLLEDTGETVKLSKEEYLLGVLFAEISATANEEAIKAQVVASYTYACYKKNHQSTNDYDLTDSYSTCQGYMTEDAAKEKFGDKYDEYKKIFEDAIDAVDKYIITYDGEIICAFYHSLSAGKTESAENMFGQSLPYLVPVESVGDLLSPDYFSTVTVTAAEFKETLQAAGKTAVDGAAVIGSSEKSESGTVLSITLLGNSLTGTEIRGLFSLNSANFDVAQDGDNIVFTVRGKGHGVGMSQYGANYMASLGSTFLEILSWYYPGCEMVTE